MPEFRMPSLGADMEVGTVLEWLVQPGAEVHRGDIVAVIDTAKAAVEVEVFDDGVVDEILVPVGESVPVGTPLALLAPIGAPVPSPRPAADAALAQHEAASSAADQVRVTSPIVRHLAHQHGVDLVSLAGTGEDGAVTRADVARAAAPAPPAPAAPAAPGRSSPYARRRAAELGVDVSLLTGTGRDGSVTVADVEQAAAATATGVPEPPAEPTPPAAPDRQAAMRVAIGRLMARSKREIPHYYLTATVDLERATSWLRETNRARPVPERILPAALLLKAVALGCRDVPEVNGFWQEDRFDAAEAVHLGVAVALRGGGLVTPAIHDADQLPLDELMARLRDLVARTRAGRLRRAELTDGTITVTSLGDLGVEAVHGVIYPPQVAVVGFGKVLDRPVAVDGLLGIRPTVTMTLAADHRVSDGIVGARFLTTVDRLLQRPETLLLGGRDER